MQTTHKTIRYYIDREADTPIIRTVPVMRPTQASTHASGGADAPAPDRATAGETVGQHPTQQTRHGDTRHRLANLVHASMRRKSRDGS